MLADANGELFIGSTGSKQSRVIGKGGGLMKEGIYSSNAPTHRHHRNKGISASNREDVEEEGDNEYDTYDYTSMENNKNDENFDNDIHVDWKKNSSENVMDTFDKSNLIRSKSKAEAAQIETEDKLKIKNNNIKNMQLLRGESRNKQNDTTESNKTVKTEQGKETATDHLMNNNNTSEQDNPQHKSLRPVISLKVQNVQNVKSLSAINQLDHQKPQKLKSTKDKSEFYVLKISNPLKLINSIIKLNKEIDNNRWEFNLPRRETSSFMANERSSKELSMSTNLLPSPEKSVPGIPRTLIPQHKLRSGSFSYRSRKRHNGLSRSPILPDEINNLKNNQKVTNYRIHLALSKLQQHGPKHLQGLTAVRRLVKHSSKRKRKLSKKLKHDIHQMEEGQMAPQHLQREIIKWTAKPIVNPESETSGILKHGALGNLSRKPLAFIKSIQGADRTEEGMIQSQAILENEVAKGTTREILDTKTEKSGKGQNFLDTAMAIKHLADILHTTADRFNQIQNHASSSINTDSAAFSIANSRPYVVNAGLKDTSHEGTGGKGQQWPDYDAYADIGSSMVEGRSNSNYVQSSNGKDDSILPAPAPEKTGSGSKKNDVKTKSLPEFINQMKARANQIAISLRNANLATIASYISKARLKQMLPITASASTIKQELLGERGYGNQNNTQGLDHDIYADIGSPVINTDSNFIQSSVKDSTILHAPSQEKSVIRSERKHLTIISNHKKTLPLANTDQVTMSTYVKPAKTKLKQLSSSQTKPDFKKEVSETGKAFKLLRSGHNVYAEAKSHARKMRTINPEFMQSTRRDNFAWHNSSENGERKGGGRRGDIVSFLKNLFNHSKSRDINNSISGKNSSLALVSPSLTTTSSDITPTDTKLDQGTFLVNLSSKETNTKVSQINKPKGQEHDVYADIGSFVVNIRGIKSKFSHDNRRDSSILPAPSEGKSDGGSKRSNVIAGLVTSTLNQIKGYGVSGIGNKNEDFPLMNLGLAATPSHFGLARKKLEQMSGRKRSDVVSYLQNLFDKTKSNRLDSKSFQNNSKLALMNPGLATNTTFLTPKNIESEHISLNTNLTSEGKQPEIDNSSELPNKSHDVYADIGAPVVDAKFMSGKYVYDSGKDTSVLPWPSQEKSKSGSKRSDLSSNSLQMDFNIVNSTTSKGIIPNAALALMKSDMPSITVSITPPDQAKEPGSTSPAAEQIPVPDNQASNERPSSKDKGDNKPQNITPSNQNAGQSSVSGNLASNETPSKGKGEGQPQNTTPNNKNSGQSPVPVDSASNQTPSEGKEDSQPQDATPSNKNSGQSPIPADSVSNQAPSGGKGEGQPQDENQDVYCDIGHSVGKGNCNQQAEQKTGNDPVHDAYAEIGSPVMDARSTSSKYVYESGKDKSILPAPAKDITVNGSKRN